MTTREIELCKAILKSAHDRDGAQMTEVQLHADANLITRMSGTEFAIGLAICSARKWLTGVPKKHQKEVMLWNINDAGEAALSEL